jgi:HK97 family phage portal protein
MLHVRGLAPPGASYLWGLSPIQYAAEAIGVALAAQRFGSALFGEGAQPSSVLTTDQAMNENEAADMKARWDAAHGQGKRGTAVLSGGLQWKPVQLTPEESQFLETRQFSRSEIAGFFRVPPHMIGDVTRSTSWGTGIEEQALGFVTYTLGPWITRWEAALSQVLPKPQYAKFNVAGLLRGRVLDQAQAFRIYRETGMANVDELREKLEWGPLPDGRGQDYLQPLNYAPVLPGGGTVQTPNEPTDAPPSDQTP